MVTEEQTATIPEPIRRVLLNLAEKLESSKTSWAVTGSTSLALQGLSLVPNDIDILTDEQGAYSIANQFRAQVVDPIQFKTSSKYESHFGRLEIDGVKVELMGNLRVFRDGRWSPVMNPNTREVESVRVAGREIPVVSLDSQKASGYLQERLQRKGSRSE